MQDATELSEPKAFMVKDFNGINFRDENFRSVTRSVENPE
jgi:hypothetical protein